MNKNGSVHIEPTVYVVENSKGEVVASEAKKKDAIDAAVKFEKARDWEQLYQKGFTCGLTCSFANQRVAILEYGEKAVIAFIMNAGNVGIGSTKNGNGDKKPASVTQKATKGVMSAKPKQTNKPVAAKTSKKTSGKSRQTVTA